MIQNKYWEMEGEIRKEHTIKATKEELKNFEFIVKRYKAKESKKEHLEISAKVEGEDYGTIKASLINLESELIRLREYGVALDRIKFIELYKLIKDNYYSFEPIEIKDNEFDSEDIVDEVLEMLCEYILDNNIECQTVKDRSGKIIELYHIPVKNFNSEIADSDFKDYNPTEIKKALMKKEYTHSNKRKFDYTVKVDGNPVKMISIRKSIFDEKIMELNKEKIN